ncbi:MAG: hypothetical protein K2N85_13770 [Lachnospiraceae bacterium]|nr:hypothetical protein [Lachnospiraceae bacterium]
MLWDISIEGWLGVVIEVIILKAGTEILMDSLSSIIGAWVDSGFSMKLKNDISQYPDVMGMYDLILQRYSLERIIGSVHMELPDAMTARERHGLTRRITEDVF